MNLFRSEEHAKNWSGWRPEAAGRLLPLNDILAIFSAPYHQQRLNGRYISAFPELRKTLVETIERVSGGHPFWSVSPP